MPVEIRELVIKAIVTDEGKQGLSSGTTTDGQLTSSEELIKICIDKIMEILKEKNGR